VFKVPKNDNNGTNSLHGGFDGYNTRNWTVITQSNNSVTFSLVDADGKEGFPGFVFNTVTYTLDVDSSFKISMRAFATEETPILLSAHNFWNLEAYKEKSRSGIPLRSVQLFAICGHRWQIDTQRELD
ncbi:hypothetical protein MPER_08277, partial [Moniliophthora perniciosa FA553]